MDIEKFSDLLFASWLDLCELTELMQSPLSAAKYKALPHADDDGIATHKQYLANRKRLLKDTTERLLNAHRELPAYLRSSLR